MFFPEGTFSPQPGLLKFHTGAFVDGGRGGLPGRAGRGARDAPRAAAEDAVCRSPSRIEVEFLPAARATADRADNATMELRDRRARDSAELQEPDLSAPPEPDGYMLRRYCPPT